MLKRTSTCHNLAREEAIWLSLVHNLHVLGMVSRILCSYLSLILCLHVLAEHTRRHVTPLQDHHNGIDRVTLASLSQNSLDPLSGHLLLQHRLVAVGALGVQAWKELSLALRRW